MIGPPVGEHSSGRSGTVRRDVARHACRLGQRATGLRPVGGQRGADRVGAQVQPGEAVAPTATLDVGEKQRSRFREPGAGTERHRRKAEVDLAKRTLQVGEVGEDHPVRGRAAARQAVVDHERGRAGAVLQILEHRQIGAARVRVGVRRPHVPAGAGPRRLAPRACTGAAPGTPAAEPFS